MSHDSLGDRMKAYECASRIVLPRRLPVIIRVDGKAFHSYTASCTRPFDEKLGDVMVDTAKKLCESIQGAQLAYTQSDEISVLVHSYKKFDSSAWFDNQVQKMASVAAGIASSHFTANSWKIWARNVNGKLTNTADDIRAAVFDARVFVVPEADVCNYFLWRQQDATRNSVQMLARSLYSHNQCENKNGSELQEMCFEKGHNWNDLAVQWKRGVCLRRVMKTYEPRNEPPTYRTVWEPDYGIPQFNLNRYYVDSLLKCEES